VIRLSGEILASAQELLFRHPLRAADAVQVACALRTAAVLGASRLTFITADRRQEAAAHIEGLATRLLA
jgi:predicted nucleic acid-binding protein